MAVTIYRGWFGVISLGSDIPEDDGILIAEESISSADYDDPEQPGFARPRYRKSCALLARQGAPRE